MPAKPGPGNCGLSEILLSLVQEGTWEKLVNLQEDGQELENWEDQASSSLCLACGYLRACAASQMVQGTSPEPSLGISEANSQERGNSRESPKTSSQEEMGQRWRSDSTRMNKPGSVSLPARHPGASVNIWRHLGLSRLPIYCIEAKGVAQQPTMHKTNHIRESASLYSTIHLGHPQNILNTD